MRDHIRNGRIARMTGLEPAASAISLRPQLTVGRQKYLLEEIATREKAISAITDRLFSASCDSIEGHLGNETARR
jgi:hypothetical protein